MGASCRAIGCASDDYPARPRHGEAGAAARREEHVTVRRGSTRRADDDGAHEPLDIPDAPVHRASTTSASPCPTSTRRSRSTATPSACSWCTRRPTRSRASARRWSPSATPARASSCSRRSTPESTIAKFLDRSGPGLQQLAYRVDRRRGGRARSCASAACACCTTSPGAARPDSPDQLRAPQGRRRRARRARRARRRRRTDGRTTERPLGYPPVTVAYPPRPPTEPHDDARSTTCSRSSTPSSPATPPARTSPPSSCPESYRAVTVHKDEVDMFEGLPARTRTRASRCTSRTSPLPELGPGEALVAVMASAINYNTVWTSIFEPVLDVRLPRALRPARRRWPSGTTCPTTWSAPTWPASCCETGPGVHTWKPGDEVVAHCLSVELEDPDGHNDTMLDPRAADLGLRDQLRRPGRARAGQVQPADAQARATSPGRRPPRPGLVNSTAYRQLVSHNGAGMKQGDNVLIWGASGGLGGLRHAVRPQRRRHPGLRGLQRRRRPTICRTMGAELIIDRSAEGYQFWKDEHTQDPKEWQRFGKRDPRAHRRRGRRHRLRAPGPRDLRRVSVYVARKGGTIVTCASTSGYMHEYDNRYLWMNLKRIIGSHFANYREAWEANRLIAKGMIHPTLSQDLRRSTRSARPRSTSTTTPTRARSACSASPPRRASACATRRSARSTSTRSTASAASERTGRPVHSRSHWSPARPPDTLTRSRPSARMRT